MDDAQDAPPATGYRSGFTEVKSGMMDKSPVRSEAKVGCLGYDGWAGASPEGSLWYYVTGFIFISIVGYLLLLSSLADNVQEGIIAVIINVVADLIMLSGVFILYKWWEARGEATADPITGYSTLKHMIMGVLGMLFIGTFVSWGVNGPFVAFDDPLFERCFTDPPPPPDPVTGKCEADETLAFYYAMGSAGLANPVFLASLYGFLYIFATRSCSVRTPYAMLVHSGAFLQGYFFFFNFFTVAIQSLSALTNPRPEATIYNDNHAFVLENFFVYEASIYIMPATMIRIISSILTGFWFAIGMTNKKFDSQNNSLNTAGTFVFMVIGFGLPTLQGLAIAASNILGPVIALLILNGIIAVIQLVLVIQAFNRLAKDVREETIHAFTLVIGPNIEDCKALLARYNALPTEEEKKVLWRQSGLANARMSQITFADRGAFDDWRMSQFGGDNERSRMSQMTAMTRGGGAGDFDDGWGGSQASQMSRNTMGSQRSMATSASRATMGTMASGYSMVSGASRATTATMGTMGTRGSSRRGRGGGSSRGSSRRGGSQSRRGGSQSRRGGSQSRRQGGGGSVGRR